MPDDQRGLVVGPEEGEAVWAQGHLFVLKVDKEATGGSFSVTEMLVAPAPVVGAPPHIHMDEDEAFYVLEGRALLSTGEPRGRGTYRLARIYSPRHSPRLYQCWSAARSAAFHSRARRF